VSFDALIRTLVGVLVCCKIIDDDDDSSGEDADAKPIDAEETGGALASWPTIGDAE
jgi:hypothetical protein